MTQAIGRCLWGACIFLATQALAGAAGRPNIVLVFSYGLAAENSNGKKNANPKK